MIMKKTKSPGFAIKVNGIIVDCRVSYKEAEEVSQTWVDNTYIGKSTVEIVDCEIKEV